MPRTPSRRRRRPRRACDRVERRRPSPGRGRGSGELFEQVLGRRRRARDLSRGVELDDAGGLVGLPAGLARFSDEPTTDGTRKHRRCPGEQVDVARLELRLSGAPQEDHRTPHRAIGDEAAAKLGAEADRGQEVAKARAPLRSAARRLDHRRRLSVGACELFELVDVVDGVFVVGEDREAVGEVLEAVLGDQIRPRIWLLARTGRINARRPARPTSARRPQAAPGGGASAKARGQPSRFPRFGGRVDELLDAHLGTQRRKAEDAARSSQIICASQVAVR
jgi:hypothetical protein